MSKNPRKRPSHAGIQNIKKNKARKRSQNQGAHFNSQLEDFANSFLSTTPHWAGQPLTPPSPSSLFEAAQEGLSNLSDVGGRALRSFGDAFYPNQAPSNDNDLNSILNRAHFTSPNKRPRNSPSPPRSPSPDRQREDSEEEKKYDSDRDESDQEQSDSDEEFQDADNDNPTPAAGRPRVKPVDPYVVHCEMSDIDSHHLSYNITSTAEVWNDPTIVYSSSTVPPPSTDIGFGSKYGYAEIDAYKFQPIALWNAPEIDDDSRARLQSLFNLYQEFRLVKITASYYPNNNNTVTAPGLINVLGGTSQYSMYPAVEGIVYQPYNMCMRFDRNDAVPFTEPNSTGATIPILQRIFTMESMNGTKCFRSDQPCSFSFEPTTLAGIVNNSDSGSAQPILAGTTVAARPIDAPWQPTKVANSSGSNTVFNLNTVFYSLKVGMYNLQVMNNLKKYGQLPTISGSASPKIWHYAVQLGNMKFSWRFEFRIREERPIVSQFQTLEGITNPVSLFTRLHQTFPSTVDEEKSDDDMLIVAEKNLKRSAANAGLEMLS